MQKNNNIGYYIWFAKLIKISASLKFTEKIKIL